MCDPSADPRSRLGRVFHARLLAADAERDAAAHALREHYAAGRLELDELEARLGRVYGARTHGQLARAFGRLPEAGARRRRLLLAYLAVAALLVGLLAWLAARRVVWPLVRLAVKLAVRRALFHRRRLLSRA